MIYGNKFLNYDTNSYNESVVLIDEFNNLNNMINSLNENIMMINEGAKNNIFNNIFTKFKQIISKIISFISNIVITALEKIMNFANKIINWLKSKKKIADKDIKDMENQYKKFSSNSDIKESTIYEYSAEDDYEQSSNDKFRYFLLWAKPAYNSAVKEFTEMIKRGYTKKYNIVFNYFMDNQFDKIDDSINELEDEYNNFEKKVNKLFSHFVNNYDNYNTEVDNDDHIFDWQSLTIKKEGEDKYFTSSIISSLQDTNVTHNDMIKSMKKIKDKLDDLRNDVDDDEDDFKRWYGKDHSEKINRYFSIASKYISLSLKTTNDIIDNYVKCIKVNERSLIDFAKYGYKNLYE